MYNSQGVMDVNGLKAIVNTPEALECDYILTCGECGHEGEVDKRKGTAKRPTCPACKSTNVEIEEIGQGLPPHDPRPSYVVDEYPACPEPWMHGSSKAGSFFVPVEAGRGMWFDFTRNMSHKHHVAVVVSVQGLNPVTGHPCNNDLGLRLQQIKDKCPKHEVDLQQDRYCPKCKYKLPGQNYISTTTGESLWIDGFRGEDGQVRQYILTEDDSRGVAAQIMGDQRVWAIGFAFYLSKEPKPEPKPERYISPLDGIDGLESFCSGSKSMSFNASPGPPTASVVRCASVKSVKRLEVGAGARIEQEVGVDPEDIDFWREEPEALIYVNYVSPQLCKQIIGGGKRQDKKDGFLGNVKVGN